MIDLKALLRRNEALDRLAVASTFRRAAVPAECGQPLTVLPTTWPFPGPLSVYYSVDGGLWFEVQGASAYANPERVNESNVYGIAVYR